MRAATGASPHDGRAQKCLWESELQNLSRLAHQLGEYRGRPPVDVGSIRHVLLRISRLFEEIPEMREFDVYPLIVVSAENGCRIVDARIRADLPTS